MPGAYGAFVRSAREFHRPKISAKDLAEYLEVKQPFITDIEKGRRLPSVENQEKIKKLLACDAFPGYMFDDYAADDNADSRIVAEDLAKLIKGNDSVRKLLRLIINEEMSSSQLINAIIEIGESHYAAE